MSFERHYWMSKGHMFFWIMSDLDIWFGRSIWKLFWRPNIQFCLVAVFTFYGFKTSNQSVQKSLSCLLFVCTKAKYNASKLESLLFRTITQSLWWLPFQLGDNTLVLIGPNEKFASNFDSCRTCEVDDLRTFESDIHSFFLMRHLPNVQNWTSHECPNKSFIGHYWTKC